MTELPEGVERVWVVREMQGRRLKVEGPVVPRDPETGLRETAVIALADLPAILAAERKRWEAELLGDEAVRQAGMALAPDVYAWQRRMPGIEDDARECIRAALNSTKTTDHTEGSGS